MRASRSGLRDLFPYIGLSLAASAAHFVDNALCLDLYPGPAWFSVGGVLVSWLLLPVLAAVAVYRASVSWAVAFGMTGFFGFAHYAFAPIWQVPLRCDLTIFGEAAASVLLLVRIRKMGAA